MEELEFHIHVKDCKTSLFYVVFEIYFIIKC